MIQKSDWQKVKETYQKEGSFTRTAKMLGFPRRQVRKCLIDQGIPIVATKDKYTLDETAFDEINNELAAYWLGFIYAEGCVYDTALRIDLHARDTTHLEKIKPFLKTERPLLPSTRKNGTPKILFTTRSKHMSARLRQLGILPYRPNAALCISQIPQEHNKHFIRGYMDGDGSIRKEKPGIRFIGQPDILQWIIDTCAKDVGTNPDISLYAVKKTEKVKTTEFFRKEDVKRMLEYLYGKATVWLERKRDKTKLWK